MATSFEIFANWTWTGWIIFRWFSPTGQWLHSSHYPHIIWKCSEIGYSFSLYVSQKAIKIDITQCTLTNGRMSHVWLFLFQKLGLAYLFPIYLPHLPRIISFHGTIYNKLVVNWNNKLHLCVICIYLCSGSLWEDSETTPRCSKDIILHIITSAHSTARRGSPITAPADYSVWSLRACQRG